MFKRFLQIAGILLFLSTFQSCVSAYITADKSKDYDGKIKEIVVFLYGEQRTFGFFNSLHDKLSRQFEKNGIKAHFHSLNITSFEKEADILEKTYKNITPDCVMSVRKTEVSITSSGPVWIIPNRLNTKFTIDAYVPKTMKSVWKAEIISDSQTGFSAIANKSAKLIFETMKEDGLFQ
jgi:hypothetical protein